MNVAIHGNATAPVGMYVVERYHGEIEDYDGSCSVLYTGQELSKNEYYYLKYKLLRRKVELIHPYWNDEDLNEFVVYLNMRESERWPGGRLPYGFIRRNGVVLEDTEKMAMARRIIELHDEGLAYRVIHEKIGGSPSLNTIYTIVKNRDRYEKKKTVRREY